MSLLTYGMIGDRLSDLVAELREFDELSNPAIAATIFTLNAIREECDIKVVDAMMAGVVKPLGIVPLILSGDGTPKGNHGEHRDAIQEPR